MNLQKLIEKVNGQNLEKKNDFKGIVDSIDISNENFSKWVDDVFSEKVDSFDMGKLPYLIDELYQTNDKFKFMLCCMLLESTCERVEFVTPLENYPLFVEKFKTLTNTLVTVYDRVDNGIANCMSLIILKNDPEFKYFNDDQKNVFISATKRKLTDILNYLKTDNINPVVYDDLEVIVDMACYLKSNEIKDIINEIDAFDDNKNADVFIVKYKCINGLEVSNKKLKSLEQNDEVLCRLYSILERLGFNEKYLSDVTQESIAKSNMINWLMYPTELGSVPDKIELLGEFIYNNTKCYAFKFSKEGFKVEGDLLGVSGGFPLDKVSSISTGYTFSKFEKVEENWQKQAEELVNFIIDYWKKYSNK